MNDDVLSAFAAHERAQGLAPATIRNRASILRGVCDRSGYPLLTVTTEQLREHLGRDGVSIGTRRTERNAITAFFQFLVDEGLRADNPTTRLAKVRVSRGLPRPFSREQIEAMLTSGTYRRGRAMILLGYHQGFRRASIARVHGHDIDVAGGTIRTIAKGSKNLVFPLHPVIAELSESMPRDSWWFPAGGGRAGHVNPSAVSEVVQEARLRAGIHDPKLTAHSLRHAFATDLFDAGVDIAVIAELMGHESVATTQIYAAVSAARKREGLLRLAGTSVPSRSGRGESAQPIAA